MIGLNHLSYLLKLSNGFMPSRIFLTAVESGVFGKLQDQQLTARQVARELQTDERVAEILRNALAATDIPEKNGGFYSNALETGETHHRGNVYP